jgi:MOSC domain-containing protein YiiM
MKVEIWSDIVCPFCYIGNVYKIGSVYLKAIQPRFPCFKLNIRFGTETMLQQFLKEEKHGTYFSVVQEGTLKTGEPITLAEASGSGITIQQLTESYNNKGADKEVLEQIIAIDCLPARLRNAFKSFL